MAEILQLKGIINTTKIAVREERILLSIVFVLGTEMKHPNSNEKKKNLIVSAAIMLLSLATIILITTGTVAVVMLITAPLSLQSAQAYIDPTANLKTEPKAPSVITGENIYIIWWTDRGTPNANGEVMFRASTDGGQTFGNKTNLSNTDTVDSINAEIAAEGENVIVTWWETNQTSNIPVARISNDAGETFGPMMMLAANGTLASTEEEGGGADGGETTEEEAVGGAEVAE
jgi:hypothetical protein